MNNEQISNEIIELEREYWEAMKNNDVEYAISLTHFPCTVTGPHGARKVSENEYRHMMKSSIGDQYKNLEIENAQVDVLNDNTAMIYYSTHVNGSTMLDVSTWVRENGRWVCAFHSENPQKIH